MPLRSHDSSTLQVGLLMIPVKIYSPKNTASDVELSSLHLGCGGAVKEKKVCGKCAKDPLAKDEIGKGYEFAKDRMLEMTEAELKELREEGPPVIDVKHSITPDIVPTMFFTEGLSYLGPDKGGHHAFGSFVRAMSSLGVAFFAERLKNGAQTNVLLTPKKNGLIMHTLRFGESLYSIDELEELEPPTNPEHAKLARRVVKALRVSAFDPTAFPDRRKARFKELLEQRAQGGSVAIIRPSGAAAEQLGTLEDTLQASLAAIEKAQTKARPSSSAPRKRASNY